jgi:UDP-N-acetylglucosamine transferase subunit ALG13
VPFTDRASVFVTVGTDHHPFDRLVRWTDDWLRTRPEPVACFVQSGTSRVPEVAASEPYLAFDDVLRSLREADVVVTHGGTGSIMLCRLVGTAPIVVPRVGRLGEHVDDHQVRFVQRVGRDGDILVAEDEERFRDLVESGLADPASRRRSPRRGRVEEAVARFESLVSDLMAPSGGRP